MVKKMNSSFIEVYGNTLRNIILEYILENQDIDFAVGDMAKEVEISKPKAYQITDEFIKKGYITKSRVIGKTQLYKLNKESNIVKVYLRNFRECLKLVVEKYAKSDKSKINANMRAHTVAAKSF
jgi:sugar-specific transcriptional regulator TrmB